MSIAPNPRKSIAVVFLLPNCDMDCGFCGSELGFDRLGFNKALKLLGRLSEAGYRNVVLGGGEPALWRDGDRNLGHLAAAAKELGFLVQINTNGIALPTSTGKSYLDWQAVDRFIFPLDGTSAGRHDQLRTILGNQPGGHFNVIERRVAECNAAGRELTFGTVLTSTNVTQINGLIEIVRRRLDAGVRVHAWHLYRFQAVGRGGAQAANKFAIDTERYLVACQRAKAAELPLPVYQRDDMLRSTSVEFFWHEQGQLQIGSEVWGSTV